MVALRHFIPRIALACMLLVPLATPGLAFAAATDAFEAGAGDDTPATARDVSTLLDANGTAGWFGEPMSTESHTFDTVNDATKASDEDWVKFTVTPDDMDGLAVSFVFEAVATDRMVDPVIELYGPVTTPSSVNYTAPGDLPQDPVWTDFTGTDPLALAANDEGPFFSLTSSSLSFIPESAGTYYLRIRPYYQYEGGTYPGGFNAGEGAYTLRVKIGQLTRVFGATRVDTAVALSRERFASIMPFSESVVLANGYGFADALSGSTLAGMLRCPVLLTPQEELPASVRAEIVRLGAKTVYILGGEAAISTAVYNAVAAAGATPVRVAGATRTETARLVALEAANLAPTAPVAFLANAHNFPDALAASPMATYNGAPVLLTPKDTLDPQVARALGDATLGITDVVIVGGSAAVSDAVASQVASLLGGAGHVRRIAGASRFETARDFAVWATGIEGGLDSVGTPSNPGALAVLDFARIGIASGRNFPDALAGGVFCGLAGSPILLTEPASTSPYLFTDEYTKAEGTPTTVPPGQDYWFASDLAILRSYVFGGTAAVSDGVFLLLDLFSGPAF